MDILEAMERAHENLKIVLTNLLIGANVMIFVIGIVGWIGKRFA